MARLPKPGQDDGTWGVVLNDYLSQSLKDDGSLKDNSVTSGALASGSVKLSNISTSNSPSASQVLSYNGTNLQWANGSVSSVTSVVGQTGVITGSQIASDSALTATFATITSTNPAVGSASWLKLHAGGNIDALITGAITRDANGAATSAGVIWPDGVTGTYTATTLSVAFPGAVDAFTVTYAGSPSKTVTQPAVTRDPTNGTITSRPAMTVA